MEQMTEKINEQKPDLVVMAGDIFDNEYEALDDPEKREDIERDPLKVWCVCMLRKPRYQERFWRDLPLAVRKRREYPGDG